MGLDVYTTHEPCLYCAMALVHSRVNRLFYIKKSKTHGAIETDSGMGLCIHNSKQLNWTYGAFRWCGQEIECPDVDDFA